MNHRLLAALCALPLLTPFVYGQTNSNTPERARRTPEPYKPTIPPSPGDLTVWPKGMSPQEVGKAVAEHFVVSPLGQTLPYYGDARPANASRVSTIGYPEVCSWYGAFTFAEVTHDDALREELIKRFQPLLPGGAEASRIPKRHHVDDSIFGVVPLQIAIDTKGQSNSDPKYLEMGQSWADRQWGPVPAGTPAEIPADDAAAVLKAGLSPETRYWVDDMYMLVMLQLEAYRATGDRKYLDRDAKEMVSYLDRLQQPNGLFYHAPDVKYFWGRGDGWFAAGMAEMLRTLPANHPDRPRIMKGYKLMMAALLKYQGADGMWRELIDHPEAWPESSSSAMFTFAMITGVKHGWLDEKTYAPAARKGWLGVVGYVDQNHDVTQVCTGTGKFDSLQYYLDRKRETGNLHGQAPVMWAATALLRDEK